MRVLCLMSAGNACLDFSILAVDRPTGFFAAFLVTVGVLSALRAIFWTVRLAQ